MLSRSRTTKTYSHECRYHAQVTQLEICTPTASMVPHINAGIILNKFYSKLLAKTAPVSALTYTDALVEPRRCQARPIRPSSALRLPSELLQEIFSIYAQLCPRWSGPADDLEWDSWMQVTHVCRRWRSVALAHPALWTRVTVANARVARALFHRSGELPLDVVCYVSAQGRQPAAGCDAIARAHERLEVTMQELHRLRRLEIVSTSWSRTFASHFTWVGKPAPLLESLVLDIRAPPPGRCEPIISTFTLFQASNLTRLRSLYLSDEAHQWSKPLPCNLRTLEIANAHLLRWEKGRWTFNATLLNALAAVAMLEKLVVADDPAYASKASRPTSPCDLPHIALPHLRSIAVRNALPLPSLCLLDHLDLPSTTRVQLELLHDEDLDVPAVTPLLARCLGGRAAGSPSSCAHRVCPTNDTYEIRTLRLETNGDLHLTGWTEDTASATSSNTLPTPKIDIHFALPPSPPSSSSFCSVESAAASPTAAQRLHWSILTEDLLEDVLLPAVTSLHLGPLAPYALLTDLRRTLAGLPALAALHVDGWSARALLALLHTTQSFSTAPFLPRLRTLALEGVHFPLPALPSSLPLSSTNADLGTDTETNADRPREPYPTAHPHPPPATDPRWHVPLLAARLAHRAARGHALRTLVLSRCFNVTPADAAVLRASMGPADTGVLRWDGLELVGGAAVWVHEVVPYGVRYPWEAATAGDGDGAGDLVL